MTNKDVSQFKDQILEKIKSEELKMKPKMHFVFKSALYIISLILGTIFLIYLLSFLLYFFNAQSLEHTRDFGFYGLKIFLVSLPWIIIILSLILFIILEILVRHFKFGYKKPIIYSLSAIIIFMSLTSLVIAKTSLHNNLNNASLKQKLPVMQNLYNKYSNVELMHRGVARDVKPERFILEKREHDNSNDDGEHEYEKEEKYIVIITERTRLKPGVKINDGDTVIVVGREHDDEIIAEGIHLFDIEDRFNKRFKQPERSERPEQLQKRPERKIR